MNLLKSPYGQAYDPKTGYYLYVQHEFDGASNTIFISRTPEQFGYGKLPSHAKRSISLVSGEGIRIGDSVRRLQNRLGHPTSVIYKTFRGQKQRIDCYYHNNAKKQGELRQYEAFYVSHQGRIQAIRFVYYRGTW